MSPQPQPLQAISVRHNIEVAHRLLLLPGKCENIHGHSMQVELMIFGAVNDKGILAGLEFGTVKKQFRSYLDETYDHHLLLNDKDPWSTLLAPVLGNEVDRLVQSDVLPGLVTLPGDPTTENIARWIGEWAYETFGGNTAAGIRHFQVIVDETATNSATWEV